FLGRTEACVTQCPALERYQTATALPAGSIARCGRVKSASGPPAFWIGPQTPAAERVRDFSEDDEPEAAAQTASTRPEGVTAISGLFAFTPGAEIVFCALHWPPNGRRENWMLADPSKRDQMANAFPAESMAT